MFGMSKFKMENVICSIYEHIMNLPLKFSEKRTQPLNLVPPRAGGPVPPNFRGPGCNSEGTVYQNLTRGHADSPGPSELPCEYSY